jgi:hypothetical protein
MYKEVELELVDFKYLGLIINFNGSFKLAVTELKKKQASSAMYALIGKCSRL